MYLSYNNHCFLATTSDLCSHHWIGLKNSRLLTFNPSMQDPKRLARGRSESHERKSDMEPNHLQHCASSSTVSLALSRSPRTLDLALTSPRTVGPTRTHTVETTQFLLDCVSAVLHEMAPSTQQVFIDGTFADLAQELAEYLNIGAEIQPLLEENKKDDALKRLVTASTALNSSPEKEFTAAYNLLVYLVIQSPQVNIFLPRICENLSRPITSSPVNGPGLALSVLTTVFNLLQPDNEVRFNVFQAILRLVKSSGLFEMLRPQLKKLDNWLVEWDVDEEDQRKLFGMIADTAEDAGEEE